MLISNIYNKSNNSYIKSVLCGFNNDKMQLYMLLLTQTRQVGFALSVIKLK